MAPTNALGSDTDSDRDDTFTSTSFKVNERFADKYDTKKRTEELSKLQDKYGKDYQFGDSGDEDDSEDLSDDDEDAELVTPSVDAAILATLAKIRAKDPSVYEAGRNVFDEEEARTSTFASSSSRTKASSSKPVLLKDYQRARLLANPTGDERFDALPASLSGPTPVQEQAMLKREITAAFHAGASESEDEGDDEGESDDGGFLTKRVKGQGEQEKDEKAYEKFLETAVGKKAVKAALGDEDAFLKDYILNRGWIDREAAESHVPSYEEITGPSRPKERKKSKSALLAPEDADEEGKPLDPGAHDEDDEEYEEVADEYETKYNFRFEQAGAADLVSHSRSAVASVRKPTTAVTARARARDAAKERKEEEKLQRKEEVRRLKALKRKEVEDKLKKLVEAAGAGTKGLEELDLEKEWNEEEHEALMKKVYGEEYEGAEDNDFKPTWDDDIDITDLVGSDDEAGTDAAQALDDEIALHLPVASTSALPADGHSADFDFELLSEEEVDAEEAPTSKKSKKEKKDKKGKKPKRDEEGFPTELLEAAGAGGDAERKALLDRLVDEYYNIDYEDKVGGVKTRFHYAKVQPQSFNLSAEEILLATDAELNSFMSLKKLAPYRQDSPQWLKKEHDKQRKKVRELRDVLKKRKWGEEVDEVEAERELEKRKEKKRRYMEGGAAAEEGGDGEKKAKRAKKDSGGGGGGGGENGGGEQKTGKKRAGKAERKRVAAAAAAAAAAAQ